MKNPGISRRTVLKGSGAVLAGAGFSTRVMASAPPPGPVTPALIEAAKKEGKVSYYASTDLPVAEKLAKAFEAKYPGIAVRVERTGAERVFQRIGQEYSSNIHAVDVVNSSDAAHFIVWQRDGECASCRIFLSIIAYNTNLVKAEDAPKSFADLLDPKWKGKIVKAHPGYSGTIMTATYQLQRDLGWSWFEQLAKQNVMQVQSAADPPKKLDLGERAVMADGNEYSILQLRETGHPVEPVYATEGSPMIIGPNGIFKGSPNPNAAKLFQSYCFSREAQQLMIDFGGLRSVHPQIQEKASRTPLKDIKT